MNRTNRIVFNTGIQYLKTFLNVVIMLYTSRLVLDALGVDDFGIYSLVGGIVSMLTFIQGSLTTTTQRYLSYYQGQKDMGKQILYFNNSIIIQIALSTVLCLLMIGVMDWLFDVVIYISPNRIEAAKFVYACTIVTLFFNMACSPFLAVLIAHENILYSSIVQIADTILKLPIAIALYYLSAGRLEFFAAGLSSLYILNFALYFLYCIRKYNECTKFSFRSYSNQVARNIFSFMGWTFYGTGCTVFKNQGLAIVINRFIGTAANSAFGIALQMSGQIYAISLAIMTAIRPQIARSEGEGDRNRVYRMADISSKYSFFLLSLFSLPTIFEMDALLGIWLKKVPEYTTLFCQFILLDLLFNALTSGHEESNRAIGNLKWFTLITNSVRIFIPIVAFLLFKYTVCSIHTILIVSIGIILLGAFLRIIYFKIIYSYSIKCYLKNVLLRIAPSAAIGILVGYYASCLLNFIITYMVSMFLMSFVFYYTGLLDKEKLAIKAITTKLIKKI